MARVLVTGGCGFLGREICRALAAAIVGIVAGADMPQRTMRVNVEGSINLFEAMRLSGVRRVIHISSEETYGPFTEDCITEEHPQRPVTVYGISKLAVELMGRTYARQELGFSPRFDMRRGIREWLKTAYRM